MGVQFLTVNAVVRSDFKRPAKTTTQRRRTQRGANMIETALLIALVAMVALPAVRMMGVKVMKPACLVMDGLGARLYEGGFMEVDGRWICLVEVTDEFGPHLIDLFTGTEYGG